MITNTVLHPLAENLWLLAYPLKMIGADLRCNVTLIRLRSGKLVIHSTAPFSADDVAAIRALGEPGWLLDGVLRHDTFAKQGRAAFPGIPYLAPEGFSDVVGSPTEPIVPVPVEWDGELVALEIQGAPEARDTALLHQPSRTLLCCNVRLLSSAHPRTSSTHQEAAHRTYPYSKALRGDAAVTLVVD